MYSRIYPVAYINPFLKGVLFCFTTSVDHDNIVNPSEGKLLIDENHADLIIHVPITLHGSMENDSLRVD